MDKPGKPKERPGEAYRTFNAVRRQGAWGWYALRGCQGFIPQSPAGSRPAALCRPTKRPVLPPVRRACRAISGFIDNFSRPPSFPW